MFYGNDRNRMRGVFFTAWEKHRRGAPLHGIERVIVAVALAHPEYHCLLDEPDRYRDRDYPAELGETNPFLHLSMHIAIAEQLSTDRPPGIRAHYRRLVERTGDEHAAQHQIMECLGETMWQAQRAGAAPSEIDYLDCVAMLTKEH